MDQSPAHRILAVNGHGFHCGAALFDSEQKQLLFSPDSFAAGLTPIQSVTSLITALRPTHVVVSSRLDQQAHEWIMSKKEEMNYAVEVLSTKAFNSELSNVILENIMIQNQQTHATLSEIRYNRELSLAKNSVQVLKAAMEIYEYGEKGSFTDRILSTSIHIAEDFMYIDNESLYALQILQPPNEKTKSSSVFDLVNHTGSAHGYKTLRSWFHTPLSNVELINKRLDAVDALVNSSNGQYFEDVVMALKKLPNINQVLISIQTGKPSLPPWSNLSTFFDSVSKLHSSIGHISSTTPTDLFTRLMKITDIKVIQEMHRRINDIIDFEASLDWKRLYIRDGFNGHLDKFKVKYNELENVLRDLAHAIASEYKHIPEDCINVVYIPQLGYMISLDSKVYDDLPDAWDEVFRTTTNLYFKERVTEEMDSEYGDIYQIIVDLEIEIVHKLVTEVCALEPQLLTLGAVLGELDAVASLAVAALNLDLIRPQLSKEPAFEIKQGRNIVIEASVQSYIPSTTMWGSAEDDIPTMNRVEVITGANASGKSVYLAQLGQIAILAQIGSFVPAQSAKIQPFQRVLTKIVSSESLERNESYFVGDVRRMSSAIDSVMNTKGRSLVIIDEFGRGTDSIGGPALLGSILEKLSKGENGAECFLSTHFHELFSPGVLNLGKSVKHVHMDVLFSKKIGTDGEELTYLYELKPGLAEGSFGIECAEACGIPRPVIERAYKIQKLDKEMRNESADENTFRKAKLITREFLLWDLDKEVIPPLDLVKQLDKILTNAAV